MNRERSLGRLVTFVDAVLAIAMTLLGLPLIEVAGEIEEAGSVGALLADNWTNLLAFVLSFSIIAMFWVAHHRIYDRLNDYSTGLVWANILWLATLVFLPFPTELVAQEGNDQDVWISVLYIGTILASALAMLLQVAIIRRHPEHVAGEPISYIPSLVIVVTLVLALIIGLLIPALSLWSLFLVTPSRWISGAILRRRARATEPSEPAGSV